MARALFCHDWQNRDAWLSDESQIQALHSNGHVIGSHSCSHPARMSRCSQEQLNYEWEESTRVLTRILGTPVTTASVPGGFYSRRVAAAAARSGIRQLFTSEPVASSHIVDGCVVLGRFSIQQGVPGEWVASLGLRQHNTSFAAVCVLEL